MENETENLDSLNEETDIEVDETEDITALKGKIEELSGKNKQLFERAKKAEGFEKIDGKWVKPKPEVKPDPQPELKPQSNEPDYAKLAFLRSEGINHPDDMKFVQDEAARLKMPLTDILAMGYIKSQLETFKDQRDAQSGMPKGKGRSSGNTQNDVDYWLAKGETPDDQELAEKVIDARMHKEKQGNKFSDELYNG